MPLDAGLAALLERIAAAPYPPFARSSPEVARAAMRALTVGALPATLRHPVGAVESTHAGGRPARVYRPFGQGPFPTVVFFHGGGFVLGDLETHDQLCRRLCSGADAVVVSVDYRLAPENPFPAAVDDAADALIWVCDHVEDYGGLPVVAVAGDSAGATLAAVLAQNEARIAAQILIYPAVDVFGLYVSRDLFAEGYFLDAETLAWFVGSYLPAGTDPTDVRHSPARAAPEVLATLPPTLIATATFDPLRDEGEAYANRITKAGVEVDAVRYDGMIHGFADMGIFSPAAHAASQDIIARARRLLHRPRR
ncbi:alpha/beta hydrolase [Mycolicibacterium fortuitum]|uniref:alpha/beta hydrolase n=1 Tax=Mycolicibacterium fortuitum TaxID=1766 RepID=UPI001AF0200F|nr:alpha/beta hydrolase [Mycolicibacterium fortuitum]MBP3082685.1 alpha/beta hydrolase [Mycolicibacterium fortuitum]